MRSNARYKVALLGSGSWATALAKILTENHFHLHWWFRNGEDIQQFRHRRHHPRYLSSVSFDMRKLTLDTDAGMIIRQSDWVIICIPSAFLKETLDALPPDIFHGKYVVSGVKGMVAGANVLLNDYLTERFSLPLDHYFSITGPCHAEEVAAEKLSYLTISGTDLRASRRIAGRFVTRYLKTVINNDIWGTQYAAILKNIYAIGAGIVQGLGYGDNFLSVYIANCALEMTQFGEAVCRLQHHENDHRNAFSSACLGDLLVTCYSQYSRNRTFGRMIGKGYSVKSAQLEMNMIAEGYFAAQSVFEINKQVQTPMPIAAALYEVLWQGRSAREAFHALEKLFV